MVYNISDEYAAGFFDGEGSVMIRYDKRCDSYILKVSVSNCCRDVLVCFREKWGGSIYDVVPTKAHHKGWSDWCLQGTGAKPFLISIRPFSTIKAEQIDLAFELLSTYRGRPGKGHRLPEEVKIKRAALKEKLHSLKTKGRGLRGAH